MCSGRHQSSVGSGPDVIRRKAEELGILHLKRDLKGLRYLASLKNLKSHQREKKEQFCSLQYQKKTRQNLRNQLLARFLGQYKGNITPKRNGLPWKAAHSTSSSQRLLEVPEPTWNNPLTAKL